MIGSSVFSVTMYISCFALLLISAAIDIKYKIIPNWIILAIVLTGLGFNSINSTELGLKDFFFGLVGGFSIMFPIYVLKGWGAGDVKLIAAIGGVVGLDKIIDIIIYSVILMGVVSLPFVLFKKVPGQQLPMAPAITLVFFYELLPALSR